MPTEYTLKARVDYMRRSSITSMLFSLAQRALKMGEHWEEVHIHFTSDGDYRALIVVEQPDETSAACES